MGLHMKGYRLNPLHDFSPSICEDDLQDALQAKLALGNAHIQDTESPGCCPPHSLGPMNYMV
jgi:hypothetical protein